MANQLARLFESLKIDERPDFHKKTLTKIFINIVFQIEGFERELIEDKTTKVLTQYDENGNTVTSEITDDTVGREE